MANEDLQNVLDDIQQASLDNSTPSKAMSQQRADARAMMQNFMYQYPFNPFLPIPVTFGFDAKAGVAQQAVFPDGTLAIVISGQPSTVDMRMWGSFDGVPINLATIPDNTQTKGLFPIGETPRLWIVYGKSQIDFIANADAMIFVECYMGGDGIIG